MPTDPKFAALRQHIAELLPFNDDEFEQLISMFKVVIYKKRSFFTVQGEVCRCFGYVNNGCFRMFHTDEKGDEFILYFAFTNWWIGDKTSFYSNTPARFSVQALVDTEVFTADKEQWENALESIPKFEKWYRIKTRKSYEAAQQKLIDAQTPAAEEKYRILLANSPEIVQRIPQHYIASFL